MEVYGVIEGNLASGTIIGSVTPDAAITGELRSSTEISGSVLSEQTVTGALAPGQTITGELTIPSAVGVDPYQGEYRVTPGRETQILATSRKYMQSNVIIDPIPSNYGLITWDGSTLTVS